MWKTITFGSTRSVHQQSSMSLAIMMCITCMGLLRQRPQIGNIRNSTYRIASIYMLYIKLLLAYWFCHVCLQDWLILCLLSAWTLIQNNFWTIGMDTLYLTSYNLLMILFSLLPLFYAMSMRDSNFIFWFQPLASNISFSLQYSK